MKIIRSRIIPFQGFGAINLFGVVFAKPWMHMSPVKVNHEAIHSAQMRELLYVPFYIIYFLEWVWRVLTHKGNAYMSLSFEREAYDKESDLSYLKHRKSYAMWRKNTP